MGGKKNAENEPWGKHKNALFGLLAALHIENIAKRYHTWILDDIKVYDM